MSISALPWIADNGLRRSWTIDVISGTGPTRSLSVVLVCTRAVLVLFAPLCLGEAFPQEFNQIVFGNEFGLPARIYFLDHAFQLTTLCDLTKLDYKCSSHDEFRIRAACPLMR